MAGDITSLSETLFQKPFDDCSEAELRTLTEQYPYFAPAHFLLLKKFDPSTEEYRQQYNKAILYFHDPLSFEALVNRQTFETTYENPSETEDEAIAEEILEQSTTATPTISPLKESTENSTELTFEPFHTVDYFASQGIKLSQEDVSGDKFGKQVKSFTDWLKTMKRLPASEVAKGIDTKAEKRVENLADHSVQETEIVTESMAEVWIKQGNKSKAVEVYRKLSLLNPSKNAYFAAKIQNLNG
jgi:hypothetical protein